MMGTTVGRRGRGFPRWVLFGTGRQQRRLLQRRAIMPMQPSGPTRPLVMEDLGNLEDLNSGIG